MIDQASVQSLTQAIHRYFDLIHDGDTSRFDSVFRATAQLHGLWDGLPDVVAVLASSGWAVLGTQAAIAAVGLFLLWRRWREAKHQRAPALADAVAAAQPAPETERLPA